MFSLQTLQVPKLPALQVRVEKPEFQPQHSRTCGTYQGGWACFRVSPLSFRGFGGLRRASEGFALQGAGLRRSEFLRAPLRAPRQRIHPRREGHHQSLREEGRDARTALRDVYVVVVPMERLDRLML